MSPAGQKKNIEPRQGRHKISFARCVAPPGFIPFLKRSPGLTAWATIIPRLRRWIVARIGSRVALTRPSGVRDDSSKITRHEPSECLVEAGPGTVFLLSLLPR